MLFRSDQLAYVAGVSSNLFNEFNGSVSRFYVRFPHTVIDIASELQTVAPTASGTLSTIVQAILTALEALGQTGIRLDSAAIPNAFFGLSPNTFPDSNQTLLTLVDGGEDGNSDPLQPLLVQARGVDTIISIDAVCDLRYSRMNHTFSSLTRLSSACGYDRPLRCGPLSHREYPDIRERWTRDLTLVHFQRPPKPAWLSSPAPMPSHPSPTPPKSSSPKI